MDITQTIVFLFVFLILNVPVYMQIYRVFLKERNAKQIILISLLYWAGAIFTENLLPFIAVIILIRKHHVQSIEETYIGDKNIWDYNWFTLLKVGLLTIIYKLALAIINAIYVLVINYFTEIDLNPQEVVTDFSQSKLPVKIVLFFLIVVFAPFVEEYVFRYLLYDKLFHTFMPSIFAALLSAAIFTIAHYNAGGAPSFFGLALFCNYLYEKKGYFAAVAAHLTFNLSTIILLIFIKF